MGPQLSAKSTKGSMTPNRLGTAGVVRRVYLTITAKLVPTE